MAAVWAGNNKDMQRNLIVLNGCKILPRSITDGPTIVYINLMFRDISEINDKEMVS